MLWAWVTLAASALVILWSGRRLVRAAEGIAAATGLARGWLGFILLGLVTSLPELVVTMTGGGIEAPAIAVGNALGSNAFNLGILGLFGLVAGGALFSNLAASHVVSCAMGVLMTAAVLGAIALGGGPSVGPLSAASILILVLFLSAAWLQYVAEPTAPVVSPPRMGRAPWVAASSAVAVIVAGVALTYSAREVAAGTGTSQSLMGATLVAMATSLPELAVCWEAVRLRAYDLFAGNIFGSNAFNIFTIFFTDLTYGRPMLGALEEEAWPIVLVGAWGLALAAVALAALGTRAKRRVGRMDLASGLVVVTYLVGLAAVAVRGLNI
ncbi:MAG: hypothetical protein R6U88_04655 [Candidatus Bipolaricaulota bacterium]